MFQFQHSRRPEALLPNPDAHRWCNVSSVTTAVQSLTAALAPPGSKPYAPPMKPRVIEISKTSIKITGIIRDAKTGKIINTEETMDAIYKYLRYSRKTVRGPKR